MFKTVESEWLDQKQKVRHMDKQWYLSKAVWISIAGVAYGVGGYFAGYLDIQQAALAIQVALGTWFLRLGIK
jgi:hypothetical protein